MTPEQFQAYFADRFKSQMQFFDRRSVRSKRLYLFFQTGAIIFAVAAPLLVVALPQALKFITATVSALAAFFTTALKSFRFHESWIAARSMHELLQRENYLYTAGLDAYHAAQDRESLFIERVEAMLATESSAWLAAERSAPDAAQGAQKGGGSQRQNPQQNQRSDQKSGQRGSGQGNQGQQQQRPKKDAAPEPKEEDKDAADGDDEQEGEDE